MVRKTQKTVFPAFLILHTFCIHSGTFLNILHTFWNILEHSVYILEHSRTFWNILEHSRTFWNILNVVRRYNLNLGDGRMDRQTDIRTYRAVSSQLKIWQRIGEPKKTSVLNDSKWPETKFGNFFFWLCQGAQGVTLSVCPSSTSLSKTLNLHLSLIMSFSDQSQVSLRSVSGKLSYLVHHTDRA